MERGTDSVKLPRIFTTTAVRLAIRYTLVYALILGVALAAGLWFVTRQVDEALKSDLEQDFFTLRRGFEGADIEYLTSAMRARQRETKGAGTLYLLISPDEEKLAGNLLGWPDETGDRAGRRGAHGLDRRGGSSQRRL